MSKSALKGVLAKHPKVVGVLFTLLLLLVQAGNVFARGGGYTGP